MEKRYKLTVAAEMLGVNPWTLRRWVYQGKAPAIKTETGRVFIPGNWLAEQLAEQPSSTNIRCAIYARESSSENKAALESQKNGLVQYAQAKGYQVVHVVCEFGSGVNDNRKKLHSLLQKKDFDVLLVEHKDRLTRFGFRWFETLSSFQISVGSKSERSISTNWLWFSSNCDR